MPFTPLHMGPGLAIKAVLGRHFSLLTFGVAQVAMDIEPLIGMIRQADVLHGPTHTYAGAVCIALLVMLIAPAICRPILKRWNQELRHYGLDWMGAPNALKRGTVLLSALLGTLTHVLIDSVMHADMRPLAPWSESHALWQWVSISTLHMGCAVAGLGGLALWAITQITQGGAHRTRRR